MRKPRNDRFAAQRSAASDPSATFDGSDSAPKSGHSERPSDEAEFAIIGSDRPHAMNAYKCAEARLRSLLPKLAWKLSAESARSVEELVDHNECGIAFENMCSQLHEFDAALSSTELKEIQSIANLLNVDVSYLSA